MVFFSSLTGGVYPIPLDPTLYRLTVDLKGYNGPIPSDEDPHDYVVQRIRRI
jgi:hypothetical protein